eukprot:6921762-Karenia_brevis.AAC.1
MRPVNAQDVPKLCKSLPGSDALLTLREVQSVTCARHEIHESRNCARVGIRFRKLVGRVALTLRPKWAKRVLAYSKA